MLTVDQVLDKLRAGTSNTVEQGRAFEKLVKYYLENDPVYKNHFSKVYLYRQWREQRDEPQQDTGIDLVAENADGGVTAIQAKFYQPGTPISRKDVNTFLAESGKTPFTHRYFVTTTDSWGKNAEEILKDQEIPCNRIHLDDLRASAIDWENFLKDPHSKPRQQQNKLRPHQKQALQDVCRGLENAERGKLIMACGTGKTYTALKIAEKIAPAGGHILFLVPSLSLLSQALHEWSAQCAQPLRNFVVCSDTHVGRENEDIALHDLALPATTNPQTLAKKLNTPFTEGGERLNVVFATYHSIDTVAQAQKQYKAPHFDLVVCDEAHRTAGAESINEKGDKKASYYIKVHDNNYLRAKKRLYMTATPRIYSDEAQKKASEHDVAAYSMNNEAHYGKELHRLGFAQAVEQQLLSDYKVLVLAVNEDAAAAAMAQQDDSGALKLQDSGKIIGCWNGLAKKFTNTDGSALTEQEKHPMRRAVAFTHTIAVSKNVAEAFKQIVDHHSSSDGDENRLQCEVKHIDGTMNALQRSRELKWLREDDDSSSPPRCRILSNARCLSEGVDVPALDAVIFLNPRKSQVDVVQSVGRVMRRAEGKEYGYVILPIVIPSDKEPEEALNSDANAYKVVWQVLQALRAHDERFNAMINRLELNKQKPDKINIIGIGMNGDEVKESSANGYGGEGDNHTALSLPFAEFDQWQNAILARIIKKCGDRRYWEDWAGDVAKIAQANITRIHQLLKNDDGILQRRFEQFLTKLQKNLNPAVTADDAVEMLSQHLITRPVFDALFEGYTFAEKNPVSRSMQQMIKLLDKHGLASETEDLQGFYDSVRRRASGIDNAAGKQKIMLDLYEKFFSTAFKKQSDKLGIVYTPLEVVDFILSSADEALQKEFGRKLSDKNVHILDPFTGTGTFMARLLRKENPLIAHKDLARKYTEELHANEIVLLAYYIAAVNIEESYHDRSKSDYQPFAGIVMTDTFQLSENSGELHEDFFKENSARAKYQRQKRIQVIIGNPPYSAGQRNANDNNQNQKYPYLDKCIADTYVKDSAASNRNSLYDSYIRAIRWASDRIKDEGIVAFVTNGSFINKNAAAGVRKHLLQDFSAIYCFNLRGDQRTSGDISKREGGKIFGSGSRAPVAITIMIKKKESKGGKLYYYDIGDYLNREEKLEKIKERTHYGNIPWQAIVPNEEGDWIKQRTPEFTAYLPIGDKANKRKGGIIKDSIFSVFSRGVSTGRDAWVYNFSDTALSQQMEATMRFYNSQLEAYRNNKNILVNKFIDYDSKKVKWDRELIQDLRNFKIAKYEQAKIRCGMYRPFARQWLYFDKQFNSMQYRIPKIFPNPDTQNLVICVTGAGAGKEFSALMVNTIPNLHFLSASQCFPLYHYVEDDKDDFLDNKHRGWQDNIPDATLQLFQHKYNNNDINKEDIFYYVYGLLHSPQYKQRFAADLSKMLPRIPQVKKKDDFNKFSAAGRTLADLHLNYETASEYALKEEYTAGQPDYTVKKMRFAGKQGAWDKSIIHYNNGIKLSGIPLQAYEYQVNGKSAIEWIMERYQKTTDKDSGNINDPNQWSDDPQYILSLLKRIVHISIKSVEIIKSLPKLDV